MITELFCNVLFSVINWIFGWIPASGELIFSEKATDIFGYGVWVLGDKFFTAISVVGMAELTGMISWSIVVFVYRLVRG